MILMRSNRPVIIQRRTAPQMDLVIIRRSAAFPPPMAYQITKRVFDMSLCLLLLPVCLPIMLLCALAIRLDSTGPILFVQERIGKGGRPFRMFKFRTMRHGLDDSHHRAFMKAFVNGQIGTEVDNEQVFKPIQQTEITRVGRILRKTSLDEFPQIINVLKGEMSVIGPRPNVAWEVEEYRLWHSERLEVLPGITGLAQVRGRSGISFGRIVQYDIEYVEQQSLLLDLKILWETMSTVLLKKGVE